MASLAADLAINFERSLVVESHGDLASNQATIKYNYFETLPALMSKANLSSEEIKTIQDQLEITAKSLELPSKLFCSQFVVYIYALAYQLLGKTNQMLLSPQSSPSILFEYLTQNSAYDQGHRINAFAPPAVNNPTPDKMEGDFVLLEENEFVLDDDEKTESPKRRS